MAHNMEFRPVSSVPFIQSEQLEPLERTDHQGERCRALWGAVLYQAIVEYRQGRSPYLRKWFAEVRGGFEALCKILGINAVAARERLLAEAPVRQGNKVRKIRSDKGTQHRRRGRPRRAIVHQVAA